MNKFKEMIIRKGLNFKVINLAQDKVEVKFETAIKMKDEYNEYLYILDEVPQIIRGVRSVSLDINSQRAIIEYDIKVLDIKKIEEVLDDIKEFIIEEWDFVSDSKDEDTKKIIELLKNKFKHRVLNR
ncbi:MAG: hypothetical protein ACRCTZ_12150 [Sarcina sp.]